MVLGQSLYRKKLVNFERVGVHIFFLYTTNCRARVFLLSFSRIFLNTIFLCLKFFFCEFQLWISYFTMTAEILARSLANFHFQYVDRQTHCQISLRIHSCFNNVMTKFVINNRTDAWKTGINLFFTITNCQIVRSGSLKQHINYKFMCLSAYWQ